MRAVCLFRRASRRWMSRRSVRWITPRWLLPSWGSMTDYSQEFLQEAAKATYGAAFGGKAGYLAPVSDEVYSLELWHG